MMPEKDYGFGKCACGRWAICILNGVAKCLECFGGGLRDIRDVVKKTALRGGETG